MLDDRQLRTAWRNRQAPETISHVSEPMARFVHHTLERRVKQLSALAQVWDELVPEGIREHAALEGFRAGTLTVLVDSAPHRFELEMLLRSGLQKQLAAAFRGALSKVRVVPGQFYSIDIEGQPRYAF